MKKYLSLLVFALVATQFTAQDPCIDGLSAGTYPCANIDQLSFMGMNQLDGGEGTNDIWGWVDPGTGNEYALVGKKNGMAIVDITDPLNPVLMGNMETETSNSTWRDIKVYNNHAFVVSEAGEHGMQVLDLSVLPTTTPPVDFEPDFVYDGFGSAHNIVINEETGFAYGVGTDTFAGGLHIVDISVPLNPVLAGSFEADGYTHDAQVVVYTGPDADWQGMEIAFACNEDNVAIVDVTDKSDCQLISHGEYENPGYVHQSWLTEDQTHMLVVDETDETGNGFNTRTYIFDVQDLDEPVYLGYYESDNTASDHNLYIVGNFAYQSNYASGLRMLDVVDIENANIYEVGYFDIFPDHNNAGFSGTWSNYAWFPSGTVAVTSRDAGVHFLKPTIFDVEPFTGVLQCAETVEYEISILPEMIGTFEVSAVGLPEGIEASAPSFTAPGSTTVTLSGLIDAEPGIFNFEFILTTEYGEYQVKAALEVVISLPGTVGLNSPEDEVILDNGLIDFDWTPNQNAIQYILEVYADEDLTMLEYSETQSNANLTMPFALLDGTYYWRVRTLNNCGESEWSDVYEFTILTVSSEDIEGQMLTIYPNPSSGMVNIQGQDVLGLIRIYDSIGQLVVAENVLENAVQLDLRSAAAGVYVIQLGSTNYRLVKQ